ncbi:MULTISPECIES: hypothetical protein [unclassified Streptomyces]|uniref:hypothetical protein n=1 Tax=unclassified Streptomyces TaxID=2593676 RepID=UPI003697649E
MRTQGTTPAPGGLDALREAACRSRAEGLRPEELPMLAAHALAAGADTPGLRDLAGLPPRTDPRDLRELFERALTEAGVAPPGRRVARRHALRRAAAALVSGEITPDGLASEDWAETEAGTGAERAFLALLPPCACCLAYTVGLDRRTWEGRLRDAAGVLVSAVPGVPGC